MLSRYLLLASFWLVCFVGSTTSTFGQADCHIIIKNSITEQPLPGASVQLANKGLTTGIDGFATFTNVPAGSYTVKVSLVGFAPATIPLLLPDTALQQVLLVPEEKSLDEVTILSSTRNNQRIENSPLKVEVLGNEEMNEENTIKPGNIASILGDVSGIQIQQSSAVSGNANVRIQGLDGRYTQILRDGMPLFDGFSGGFGILTIPPLDLKQVELIKGSASTLYGGGAIGGLINLISKKPTYDQQGIITINQTTLKESNFNTYIAKRNKHVGYNFFGGVTRQAEVDVNKDGFSDVAKTDAVMLHPKFFFYPGSSTSIAIGYTGTFDTRKGGDMEVIKNRSSAMHQFYEENITSRNTGDLLAEQDLGDGKKLALKASISSFSRSINTSTHRFKGGQLNYFSEASLYIPKDAYSIVAGINATGDRFKKLAGNPVALVNFNNNTVGAFAQYTGKLSANTTVEAGLRGDHHFQYGNFILPRLAMVHHFDEHWGTRLGMGFGYKTPNPLAAQNVEYSIEDIQPVSTAVKAEKSVGYNAELNYKKDFGNHQSLFINHAFFFTTISNPVIASVSTGNKVSFSNAGSSITSKGFDTYLQLTLNQWELYGGYTFTIAERNYLQQNQFMPLTPKNRFAFVLVHEIGEKWRFGLEGSYTGPQYRDGDSKTPAYLFMAGLVERKFGHMVSIVLNCENLLDYRQSNHEALYTGSITSPVFKPLWAPIDGRVINLAVRWNWGKKK